MEIKPNMYIRFFDGTIGKVADYYYDENCVNGHTILLEGRDYWSCCEKGQFEASYNIIDLIKSKDIILAKDGKIYQCWKKYKDYVFTYSKNKQGETITLVDYQIDRILTKELFEEESYKVGE